MMISKFMTNFFKSKGGIFVALTVFLCLILLVLYVASGSDLRHSGDDFVFSSEAAEYGPIDFMRTFVTTMAGRYSNGMVIYLMYQAPEFFIVATPFLFITLFILGAFLLFRQTALLRNFLPAALLSVVFTFCLVMVPANQYQTVFWLPAYISYGLPLALLLFLFAFFIHAIKRKLGYISLLLLVSFGFFIGGLHELVAILAGILFVFAWLLYTLDIWSRLGFSGFNKPYIKKSIFYVVTGSSFVAAFIVNYLLPATKFRRSHSPIKTEGIFETLTYSWEYSIDFFQTTLREPIVLFSLFITLLICLLAYRFNPVGKFRMGLHPLTTYVAILSLITIPFLSLFITVLSARYGYGTPPPERTNFVFYFSLIFCTTILGYLLANLATKLHRQALCATVHISVLVLMVITPLSFYIYTQKSNNLLMTVHNQAKNFDIREEYIEEQLSVGNRDLLVPSLAIGDTPYPKNDEKVFPNKQIAKYYNLNTLRAYGYPIY